MILLTKEEFEKCGFIYEPDRNKCKSCKLKLHFLGKEFVDEEYKSEIVKLLPYKYIHKVIDTPNAYEGNPNFSSNPKVLVIGHTRIEGK